jgi:hypothetical protein
MAIWFQVSGVRFQVSGVRRHVQQQWASPEGTIHHLRHTLPFPQLTASGVLALGLYALMFSPIHSTYECIQCVTDTTFYRTQDPPYY